MESADKSEDPQTRNPKGRFARVLKQLPNAIVAEVGSMSEDPQTRNPKGRFARVLKLRVMSYLCSTPQSEDPQTRNPKGRFARVLKHFAGIQ